MIARAVSAIALLTTTLQAQQANDPVAQGVDNMCKEQTYLLHLSSHLSNLLTTVQQDQAALKSQIEKWELAAAAEADTKKRCLLQALALDSKANFDETATTLAKYRTAATEAEKHVQRQIGRLQATAELSKFKLEAAANGHTQTAGSTLNVKLSAANSNTKICTELPEINSIAAQTATPQWGKLHTLKLSSNSTILNAIHRPLLGIKAFQSCNAVGPGNLEAAMGSCAIIGSLSSAAVTLTNEPRANTQPTDVKVFKTADKNACNNDRTTAKPANEQEELALAVCETFSTPKPAAIKPTSISGAQLKQSTIVLNAVRNCDPDYSDLDIEDNPQNKKKLEDYVEQAYGKDIQAFSEGYVNKLNREQTPLRIGKQTTSKPRSSVNSAADRAATLSHLEGQKIKRELEAAKKAAPHPAVVDPAKEAKCQGKPQGECKEEDGCEFKEGKCQVKEGVKVDGGDSKTGTTNTTGSNSFVINKAPLWLAFLILA
uniref:Variant surface glycoprotein 573 n=1 Tax=Trypanosoma brucei TaxID=5691 RepID=M4T0C4_9TRYP|nr:variant surface glycoprotein 573 [Trypanosoma brucei]